MAQNIGKVIQISGPAVDVQFEETTLPPIYQALRITSEGFNVPAPINDNTRLRSGDDFFCGLCFVGAMGRNSCVKKQNAPQRSKGLRGGCVDNE